MQGQQTLFDPSEYDEIDHAPIYYHLVQCPVKWCRSADCPVVHTEGRLRYHRCKGCKKPFKSIQAELIQPEPRYSPIIGINIEDQSISIA